MLLMNRALYGENMCQNVAGIVGKKIGTNLVGLDSQINKYNEKLDVSFTKPDEVCMRVVWPKQRKSASFCS